MERDSGGGVRMHWVYPSRWGEEKRVLADVRTMARNAGFPPERAEDVVSALAEACLNAAEHGNGADPKRSVRVECEHTGAFLRCRVYDEGPGLEEGRPERRGPMTEEGSARGWGVLLMEELADQLRFYRGEHGFCTELTFRLIEGGSGDA